MDPAGGAGQAFGTSRAAGIGTGARGAMHCLSPGTSLSDAPPLPPQCTPEGPNYNNDAPGPC